MRLLTGMAARWVVWTGTAGAAMAAAESPWYDTYYQYRLPVTVNVEQAGWNVLPVSPSKITTEINRCQEMQFDAFWFAYNNLKVVEVDGPGRRSEVNPSAGFYLVPEGEELIPNGSFEGAEGNPPAGWTDSGPDPQGFTCSTDPQTGSRGLKMQGQGRDYSVLSSPPIRLDLGHYYLLSYRGRVDTAGGCPYIHLKNALDPDEPGSWRDFPSCLPHTPLGWAWGGRAYPSSYVPFLWRRDWTQREQLLMPYFRTGQIRITRALNGTAWVEDLSLRKVKIAFLAQFDKPGRKNVMLYYQPSTSHNFMVPHLRHPEMPSALAKVEEIGAAEKYTGQTQYRLASNQAMEVWFAETTVKLTPHTRVAQASSDVVRISCAGNEKQSFQVVISPKAPVDFQGIRSTALKQAHGQIPAANVTFQAVDYAFISNPSPVTPATYRGFIGDPLVPVRPQRLDPQDGNYALWVTVSVPPGTPEGLYQGRLTLQGKPRVSIPLQLEVYGFDLPEYSTFRTSYGGSHLTKVYPAGVKNVADFHGCTARDDLKKLARKYFDVMIENKFNPHSVLAFSEIGMRWSPPPQGYNVDAPGNYFRLYDWDFSEMNRDLQHYVEDLKLNAFAIEFTDPSYVQVFKHLPGADLREYDRSPMALVHAWQTFREATYVGYDKRPGDAYTEITQDQYDHLVMDFFRPLARNLEEHGWLDKAYILMDETYDRGLEPLKHFLTLLKSDPLTAQIKVIWCVQSDLPYTYRENPSSPRPDFDGLIGVYVPEINELTCAWEKYYFTDYGLRPDRGKLWPYVTLTSRVTIDTPGINNRATPLEVFHKGGGGYLCWESFMWDSMETDAQNPWKNPWTRWGNGAMGYFYPPRQEGPAAEPDYTVIPSLRLMAFREGVDDYEYARILEDLVKSGEAKGRDVSAGRAALADLERFFPDTLHWSQNDAWYLELRDRLAQAIVDLQRRSRENTESAKAYGF